MSASPELGLLPEPDAEAPDRIWKRFQQSRRTPPRPLAWAVPVGALLAGVAAAVALWPEAPVERALVADSAPAEVVWSDQVQLAFTGKGHAIGTSRDLTIAWESGTVRADVVPSSGTTLRIETDEAVVEVVGTVFSVTRHRLGATTEVEAGTVKVTCRDGWSGLVTAATGPRTCLPRTPAGLLGRADELVDRGAGPDTVLETLNRGIARATAGTAVHGELLVRRMHLHADAGRSDEALADARTYLEAPEASRADEAHRLAGWLLLASTGCDAAIDHLRAARGAGTAEDHILLAECLVAGDPAEATAVLDGLQAQGLDAAWTERLAAVRAALGDAP